MIACVASLARKVTCAFDLVSLAIGKQTALVKVNHHPPCRLTGPPLADQHSQLDVTQRLHIFCAKGRQIALDWRLVGKAFQAHLAGRGAFRLKRFVDGFGMPTAHHQRGPDSLGCIDQALLDFLQRYFQLAAQHGLQSTLAPVLQNHHQKRRDAVFFPFCCLICYCFHGMTLWVVSVRTKNLAHRAHSFTFAQNLGG